MKKAAVVYQGPEFAESAFAVRDYFAQLGFATTASDTGKGDDNTPSRLTPSLTLLPGGCDVTVWLSHGGWDGPSFFQRAGDPTATFNRREKQSAPGTPRWVELQNGLAHHLQPPGFLISHACHSAGSNRFEAWEHAKVTPGMTEARWTEAVAREMKIYTAGVEGKTPSANRQWAVSFAQYCMEGGLPRQASRVYRPGGELVSDWPGWLALRANS